MDGWLADLRSVAQLYLFLFSFLSQGALMASALLDTVGQVVPQVGGALAVNVTMAALLCLVWVADHMELIFLRLVVLAGAARRARLLRLAALLRLGLRMLVGRSYLRADRGTEEPTWATAQHRAFLSLYSSDAHYPRAERLLRRGALWARPAWRRAEGDRMLAASRG